VLLCVRDTGCGMEEAVRRRIFEPYFTTKEFGKGTGLGLATVYGIVVQSNGCIEVESQPNRGAAFRIYLPRVADPGVEQRAARSGEIAPPKGHETVLVAEDEEGVRSLACLVLRSGGYTVLEARTGAEALSLAAQHAGPIHVLVTDIVMPHMSGRQLADQLRQRQPNAAVLYLTGYTDEAVVRHGLQQPGTNLLQKPFTPAVLARTVRSILDKAKAE
jgi:two-component system cell cycle sensor histidine kinase/response regulator CckA